MLFNGTIEYNIKYNLVDKTEKDIKEAARKANCLTFIENNEFETNRDAKEEEKLFGTGF